MTDLVLVEQSEGVRTLTLNRPDALNALTVPAMAALADRLGRPPRGGRRGSPQAPPAPVSTPW